MKILFLSMDRGLLGDRVGGGVVKRHLFYIQKLVKQTIIVYSPAKYKYQDKVWQERLVIKATGGSNPLAAFKKMHQHGKKILQRERHDLLVAQDPFLTGIVGYQLKKRFKLPLLIDLHGDFFANQEFLKERWFNRFLLILARFLIKKSDFLRPVSSGIKDKLIKMGVPPEKIMVVPTPVDLSHFQNYNHEGLKELKRNYEGKLVLLFVGILKIEKNLDFFLKVLREVEPKYQNIKFLVIGDGPERKRWENLTKELRLETVVEFLGSVEHQQLPLYYNLAEIFVLPSTHESLGKVIMEAAMAKLPVLSSKTLGAQSLITDNQTGLLFKINNKSECLDKLVRLIKNQELRIKLGDALEQEIKAKYDYQTSLNKVFECWELASQRNHEGSATKSG